MASPHATGVAALAVSAHGKQSRSGFGMNPDAVQRLLERSATDHTCPAGGVQDYLAEGRDATFTADLRRHRRPQRVLRRGHRQRLGSGALIRS